MGVGMIFFVSPTKFILILKSLAHCNLIKTFLDFTRADQHLSRIRQFDKYQSVHFSFRNADFKTQV